MEDSVTQSKNIGAIIRDLCSERNMTVVELERKCNLGNGSINRWENGSSPTIKALLPIADYFDVSLDYLTQRTTERDQFEEWNRKYNTKKLAEEAKFFDSLGKLKSVFAEIGMVDMNDHDILLLKEYLKVLKQIQR